MPESLRGSKTAVLVGANHSETGEALVSNENASGYTMLGTAPTMLANRISFALDLKGPSYTVFSACSSSGTAINDAVQLMKSGQCEAALICGSQLCLSPLNAKVYDKLNVLSSDGKCKFMDESADGFVRSEACVVVLVQQLSDAKRVYATIVSTNTNVDGYKIEGIAHPSTLGQISLMEDALSSGHILSNTVRYIEAHGTGESHSHEQHLIE